MYDLNCNLALCYNCRNFERRLENFKQKYYNCKNYKEPECELCNVFSICFKNKDVLCLNYEPF